MGAKFEEAGGIDFVMSELHCMFFFRSTHPWKNNLKFQVAKSQHDGVEFYGWYPPKKPTICQKSSQKGTFEDDFYFSLRRCDSY